MITKERILEEIKRTAICNHGVPLGMARFEKETGISPYEWERFWPRFGDAQKEAGFAPNQMQAPHPNEFLLNCLVTLIRKLNKYPTSREIDVERRSMEGFPTKNVFQRLGSKEHVLKMLLSYCSDKEGFEDVAEICRKALPAGSDVVDSTSDGASSVGEVYLLKSGRYYKIGRTEDILRRGSEIRIQLPERVALIHSIKTDDPSGIEAYWHKRFAKLRMNGEWFDLTSAEVKSFKRWRRIF